MQKRSTLILFAALALAACHSDFGINPIYFGTVALVNGISDSDGLKAQVTSTLTLGPIAFGNAGASSSSINLIASGNYNVQFTPGASGASPFTVNNIGVGHNDLTTMVGYCTLAGNTQNVLTAEISPNAPASGQIVVQPVHAAYALSQNAASATLNFYFVTPGTTVNGSSPTISAAFGPVPPSEVLTIAGARYEIIVAYDPCIPPANRGGFTKVFDSGPKGITLPTVAGSTVFQFAAIDASSAQSAQYGAPISLVLLGNQYDSVQLFNGQN